MTGPGISENTKQENTKKCTPRDSIFKLQKVKDDKKILKDPGRVVGGEPLPRKERR